MRKALLLLTLLTLGGCAVSRDEIKTFPPTIKLSAQPPRQAAICVERNFIKFNLLVSNTEGPAGHYEVVATIPMSHVGPFSVVNVAPEGAGARLEFRVTTFGTSGDATNVAERFGEGC